MDTNTTNMNIFQLLDRKNLYLIKLDIFSRLDYRSLHTSRQVCREWNQFVLDEFWFSNTRRPMMKRRLLTEWKSAEPIKKTYDFANTKGFYLVCDDKIVCMGTRNNQTLLLEPSTGAELAVLDCGGERPEEGGGVQAQGQEDESRDVQLDMTDSVIVTATGSGVVTVWRREDLKILYQERHHGEDSILGVCVVGDLIVTGGCLGGLAALTVKQDSVSLVWRDLNKERVAISHIHGDGVMVVVGTNVGMSVWDFSQRSSPVLSKQLPCGQVCCCVISQPLVACTGLFVNSGVQIWNFLTGEKLRHILSNVNLWVIEFKNNFLATSMSVYGNNEEGIEIHPKIFLYDLTQLKDSKVEDKNLWSREISCTIEEISDPHIALNSTSMFALTRDNEGGSKVDVWDFWSY